MGDRFDEKRVRHLLDIVQAKRLTRVADIGANPLDDTPYKGLLAMGGCDVWGFEPQKQALDKLVAAAGPHENYVNAAVGRGGPARLHICEQSGFTSLLEPNQAAVTYTGHFGRGLKVREVVDIETSRLDDIDLPQFDLLKIDIQGGERDVFFNGETRLQGALAVITEVAALPLYQDQPLLGDQMRALGDLGYHLHKFLFFNAVKLRGPETDTLGPRHRNQLTDGDAVFIRDLLTLRDWDSEQLKHIAILADAVFDSLDMAALALGVLKARGEVEDAAVKAYLDMAETA